MKQRELLLWGYYSIQKKKGAMIMKKTYMKLILAIALVGSMAVGGTLAYLSDTTEAVVNTFTVGDGVAISLLETQFGKSIDETNGINGGDESKAVTVAMLPGETITKDPTVTVEGIDCYVFVDVAVANNIGEYSEVEILEYTIDDDWEALDADSINNEEGTTTYVLVDADRNPVVVSSTSETKSFGILDGDKVVVNEYATQDDLEYIYSSTDIEPTLSFVAYAVQAANLYGSDITDADAQAEAVISAFLAEFDKEVVEADVD